MSGILDFPEIFLILVVYYGTTDDFGKNYGKKGNVNEKSISPRYMELHHERDA